MKKINYPLCQESQAEFNRKKIFDEPTEGQQFQKDLEMCKKSLMFNLKLKPCASSKEEALSTSPDAVFTLKKNTFRRIDFQDCYNSTEYLANFISSTEYFSDLYLTIYLKQLKVNSQTQYLFSKRNSFEILEERVNEITKQYMKFLDETLDAKTKCEIYHKPSHVLELFHSLEKTLNKNIQDLQSRFLETMNKNQMEASQHSSFKYKFR